MFRLTVFTKPLVMITCLALLAGCDALPTGSDSGSGSDPSASAAATTSHISLRQGQDAYARVLRNRVNESGLVDYTALQRQPANLQQILDAIGSTPPERYEGWDEEGKIAFLINAYNAITLKSIIDQKHLKASIRDIVGVWKIRRHPVLGQSRTLDEIEHKILRRQFNEPRIHAALVCAAISCPPLRREPYTAEQLDGQLDDQVRRWLASPAGLQIDRGRGTVKISAIFQWFSPDWKRGEKDPVSIPNHSKTSPELNFIGRYVDAEDRAYILAGDYKLSYLDYDWSLNRQ